MNEGIRRNSLTKTSNNNKVDKVYDEPKENTTGINISKVEVDSKIETDSNHFEDSKLSIHDRDIKPAPLPLNTDNLNSYFNHFPELKKLVKELQKEQVKEEEFFNAYMTFYFKLDPGIRELLTEKLNDDGSYELSLDGVFSQTIRDKDICELLSSNSDQAAKITLDAIHQTSFGSLSHDNIMICLKFCDMRLDQKIFTNDNNPENKHFNALFHKGAGLFLLGSKGFIQALEYIVLKSHHLPINMYARRDELPQFVFRDYMELKTGPKYFINTKNMQRIIKEYKIENIDMPIINEDILLDNLIHCSYGLDGHYNAACAMNKLLGSEPKEIRLEIPSNSTKNLLNFIHNVFKKKYTLDSPTELVEPGPEPNHGYSIDDDDDDDGTIYYDVLDEDSEVKDEDHDLFEGFIPKDIEKKYLDNQQQIIEIMEPLIHLLNGITIIDDVKLDSKIFNIETIMLQIMEVSELDDFLINVVIPAWFSQINNNVQHFVSYYIGNNSGNSDNMYITNSRYIISDYTLDKLIKKIDTLSEENKEKFFIKQNQTFNFLLFQDCLRTRAKNKFDIRRADVTIKKTGAVAVAVAKQEIDVVAEQAKIAAENQVQADSKEKDRIYDKELKTAYSEEILNIWSSTNEAQNYSEDKVTDEMKNLAMSVAQEKAELKAKLYAEERAQLATEEKERLDTQFKIKLERAKKIDESRDKLIEQGQKKDKNYTESKSSNMGNFIRLNDSFLQLEYIKSLLETEDFQVMYGNMSGEADFNDPEASNFVFMQNNLILLKSEQELYDIYYNPDQVNWQNISLFKKNGEMLSNKGYSVTELYTQQFPLFKYSFMSLVGKQTELKELTTTIVGNDYAEMFHSAFQENALSSEITIKDSKKLYDQISKHIEIANIEDILYKNQDAKITEDHLQEIKAVLQLESSSNTDVAWALLCLSSVFIRASSSAFFGTENDSPLALRIYASSLMYTAYNLDENCFDRSGEDGKEAPTAVFHEWNHNHLKGLKGGFSCSAVLSNKIIGHIQKRTPTHIKDMIIPVVWL